jgi:hypothetical protein
VVLQGNQHVSEYNLMLLIFIFAGIPPGDPCRCRVLRTRYVKPFWCDFNPRIRDIVASNAVLNLLFVHFKHGGLRCNGVAELCE